jgi:succinate dehydrogenase / fumarate reductase flavoprotein subunit
VLLDLRHIGADTIRKRLPSILEIGHKFANVDATKEPIPVVPTIHYQMGGIPTNIHGQVVAPKNGKQEIVRGLYAIGECACVSVHGANRLGTNSLLDIVVFGRAAAIRAKETMRPGQPHHPLPQGAGDMAIARLDKMRGANGKLGSGKIREDMQRVMQSHAAVFRSSKNLDDGMKKIHDVAAMMADIKVSDRSLIWNTDLLESLELENLMSQAIVTLASAQNRHESRGAHAHEDYPDRDDDQWMKHTVTWCDDLGKTKIQYRPVHMNTLSNDVQVVPPKKRVY